MWKNNLLEQCVSKKMYSRRVAQGEHLQKIGLDNASLKVYLYRYEKFAIHLFSYKISITKIVHFTTYHFARFTYAKCMFKNIQKLWSTLKTSLLFKKHTNLTSNNSIVLRTQNTKFSGYYFDMNTNKLKSYSFFDKVPYCLGNKIPWTVAAIFTGL